MNERKWRKVRWLSLQPTTKDRGEEKEKEKEKSEKSRGVGEMGYCCCSIGIRELGDVAATMLQCWLALGPLKLP